MKNDTLILYGMHRSGTSLLAQWLNKTGVSMGDLVLGKDPSGNKDGHFEDIDFLRFHRDVLKQNGLPDYLISNGTPELNDYFHKRALFIVKLKNELHTLWGMKDPRVCLFVELWEELIPQAIKLVIFRDYTEVVDSLKRRYVKQLKLKAKHGTVFRRLWAKKELLFNRQPQEDDKLVAVWIHYNNQLLKHLAVGEHTIFISLKSLIDYSDAILEWLKSKEIDIEYIPIQSVFKGQYLSKEKVILDIDSNLKTDADNIYYRLREREQNSILLLNKFRK